MSNTYRGNSMVGYILSPKNNREFQNYCLVFYTLRKSLQTASMSPCRTQVQPAASFLVCSLIFIEYRIEIIKGGENGPRY